MGWLGTWAKRRKITIDSDDINNDLTHFPVLLYLSSSSGTNSRDLTSIFNEVGANKRKIAVTQSDGTTQLYVDIEKWTYDAGTPSNSKAWLWVSASGWTVSSTIDTVIFIYYDNTQPDNAYVGDTGSAPAMNVWDSNFKAVWHLSEASPPTAFDATTNNNDLTDGQTRGGVDAQIDTGQEFERDFNDWLYNAVLKFAGFIDLTVEVWVKMKLTGVIQGIVLQGNRPRGHFVTNLDWELCTDSVDNWVFFMSDNDGDYAQVKSGTVETTNWHYLVLKWDMSSKTIEGFLDSDSVGTDQNTNVDAVGDGHFTRIGHTYSGRELDAYVDEVRISQFPRSTAYVKATWETGRDELLAYGSEQQSSFYIIDVVCAPASVQRSGSNITELRCDWHDEQDLAAGAYTCQFWVRGPPPDDDEYGPFTGTVTKEGSKEYHATYDWDPPAGADVGMYDLQAKVSR